VTYEVNRNEIVAGTVAPGYISPLQGLQRLEKIMDEYVGGVSMFYVTSEPMLTRGLELLRMLKEDLDLLGTDDTLRVALHSDAPVVATDDELADHTQVTGTGYTAGGIDTDNTGTRSGGTACSGIHAVIVRSLDSGQ
jgi:hypothetical protein